MNKKQTFTLFLLLMAFFLTGCSAGFMTADTLPWVGDEAVLFKDDFTAQSGGWTTHEDTLSLSTYEKGGLRLWLDVPNYQFWSVPGLNFRDVLIHTQALKLDGPDDNMFGLICRYQDEANYYALVIGSDGYYGIIKKFAGEETLIDQAHMDFSEEIQPGGLMNELQAICTGDQLSLYVNGQRLLEVRDDALAYGDVGVIVGNFSEPGVDVLFDNFIVISR